MTRGPELRTARLLLRRWRDADLDPFAALNADPRVMRHFHHGVRSREESAAFMGRIEAEFETRGYGLWAVEVTGVTPFAGFVGLHDAVFEAPFTPAVEVGWRLAAEHWGRGYATEAARAALRFGFREVGLPQIVSFTNVDNVASQRVMERIGLLRDAAGDFEHPAVPPGSPIRPHVLYRLLERQYSATMSLLGLHHVQLNVHDVDEAVEFYVALGMTRRDDRPDIGVDGAWLDAGSQQIHLIRSSTPVDLGQHFALEFDDLDATIAALRGRGSAVSDPRRLGDGLPRQCVTHDLAGNRVELRERPPHAVAPTPPGG